jgi:hypothetical protein
MYTNKPKRHTEAKILPILLEYGLPRRIWLRKLIFMPNSLLQVLPAIINNRPRDVADAAQEHNNSWGQYMRWLVRVMVRRLGKKSVIF